MLLRRKGQMTLIMVFMIAVALILYAVSLNWTRMAANKTTVTIASNTATAALVSMMASYGHSQMETQLEGKATYCKHTGLLASLLTLLVLIVIMVAVPGAGGLAGQGFFAALAGGNAFAALITAAVLTAIGIGLQVGIADPALTKAWNKANQNIPTIEGQYLESGIRTALSSVVTDAVQVEDRADLDMDGKWFNSDAVPTGVLGERVSRFSFYYDQRMRGIVSPASAAVNNLSNFLKEFEDTMGISSPAAGTLVGELGLDDGSKNKYWVSGADAIDTSGFYRGSDSTKFFQFLWLLADTQPKLADVVTAPVPALTDASCHWCSTALVGAACTPETAAPILYSPVAMPAYVQLALTNPCAGAECCVSAVNNNPGKQLDSVGDIAAFRQLVDADCAEDPGEAGTAATALLWKKGADFDSAKFSYNGDDYPKKMETTPISNRPEAVCDLSTQTIADIMSNCTCSNIAQKNLWRNDAFDAVPTEACYFKQTVEAAKLLPKDITIQSQLTAAVETWADPILELRETMALWRGRLTSWTTALSGWLSASYADANNWSVPANSMDVPAGERAYILSKGAWGSLDSVIASLQYNEDHMESAFTTCASTFSVADCTNLPRSLVPGFDPNTDAGRPAVPATAADRAAYKTKINQSLTLAVNQTPKFRLRRLYLKDLQGRANAALTGFQSSLNYLNNVPSSGKKAETTLFDLVTAVQAASVVTTLGNQVVYGWFSPRPASWGSLPRAYGYLHVVKVEAVIPRRGGVAGFDTCTNKYPWIRTYTKGFLGSTRCYALTDSNGCVGVRVVRYDEDHDINTNGFLRFLSGVPLWRIMYHNPHADTSVAPTAAQVWDNCVAIAPTYDHINEAFLFDPEHLPSADAAACAGVVNQLLPLGVSSETCARYYLVGDKYQMRFRNCSECCAG
ncbi:MAG: hypothetical protein WCI27_03450 [Candidatus Omnitrophota bacterium]